MGDIEEFIGLHNHTEYSNFRLRDSTIRVKELIDYTHELNHKGVCITDHETVSASIQALKYYKQKKNEAGWEDYKVLLGNEIYLCPDSVNKDNTNKMLYPHFILIALNARGHEQIRELSTNSWLNNSFHRVMMRVPTYYRDLEKYIGSEKGNVVGSSACLGSFISKRILDMRTANTTEVNNIWNECINWIDYMNNIFTKGKFFLELQPSFHEEQIYVNKMLLKLSKETDTPYIITTDSHYLSGAESERKAHRIFLNSQEGDREVDDFYDTTYVMSTKEIHEYMDNSIGEEAVSIGLKNTLLVYDMAEYYDLERPLEIPYLPLNTDEPDASLYMKYANCTKYLSYFYESEYPSDRHLARELLKKLDEDEQYRNQETYNAMDECFEALIKTSEKMGVRWSAYLLTVSDIVKVAWTESIVGCGRGSGVGFLLNNMLDIIQINPLREDVRTYFWRFINPERASVLDLDLDIEKNKRDKVFKALQNAYGEDRVSKVMTKSTEGARSALLSACRGLEIDIDIANMMCSYITSDRGIQRSLHTTYYGKEEDGIKPDKQFIELMNEYPEVWEVAQKIEGLITNTSSHAGGVIVTDKPFTCVAAQMKTNNGDIITQFDLHELEDLSLIKFDLLSISLDKMHVTLDLLLKDRLIEWQGNLKDTYEKYIGIYTLERNDKDMWKMLWDHKVMSFFQMEAQSGIQAVSLCRPDSVASLATINSCMRLMAQEEGAELPLEKYTKFKNDITLWYKEMDEAGLTLEEQEILKEIVGGSCGICEAQEYLVLLTQHQAIGGFSLGWGDRLRKSVAKKKPEEFKQLEKEFFENMREKNLSENLCNYVWHTLISTQRGYGFNRSHTLAYSLIGLQELNLCWKYDPIYWSAANLIVDSGSIDEDTKNKATDYGKIAKAIGEVQSYGYNVVPPEINSAEFGFSVNAKDNEILYAFKSMNAINDDVARLIIENKPYSSLDDFITRMIDTKLIKNKQMIQLIKAGCFTKIDDPDRRVTMDKYLKHITPITETLNMQNWKSLLDFSKKYDIIPIQLNNIISVKLFVDYCLSNLKWTPYIIDGKKVPKKGYHDRYFTLNDYTEEYYKQHFSEDTFVDIEDGHYVFSEKKMDKEFKAIMQPLKDWFDTQEAVDAFNNCKTLELWEKYGQGSPEKWYFDSLSYYPESKHELRNMNKNLYSVVDYYSLPEEPEAYETYTRTIRQKIDGVEQKVQKVFPKYRISRIAGTVLDTNKDKHMVTLLTVAGEVVTVKYQKGAYLNYSRVISKEVDGDKVTLDGNWFKRGEKLLICGHRDGLMFRAHKYSDTIFLHTTNRILSVNEDGSLELQTEKVRI